MKDQEVTDNSVSPPGESFVYPDIHGFELAVNILRSLMSEVGTNRALEAIRGYSKVWGINAANMAKQRFGLKGSELEDVALPYYLYHCASSFGHIKPLEIRDGKAVVELYACPAMQIPNCPPEICIALSHYIAEGICEATNPDYEIIFTHHIANRDDCCRYVVKKKSMNVDLTNPGNLQKTIPLNLSQEEIFTLATFVAYSMVNMFTSASIQLIGSERTLELALPQARAVGNNVGKKLMGELNSIGDIQIIGEKLDLFGSWYGRIGSPATVNGPILEKKITECPCKGSPIEVCMQFEAVANGICEAINPDYSLALDRRMSEGESCCHWIVRKKAIKVVNQQEPTQDDSFGY